MSNSIISHRKIPPQPPAFVGRNNRINQPFPVREAEKPQNIARKIEISHKGLGNYAASARVACHALVPDIPKQQSFEKISDITNNAMLRYVPDMSDKDGICVVLDEIKANVVLDELKRNASQASEMIMDQTANVGKNVGDALGFNNQEVLQALNEKGIYIQDVAKNVSDYIHHKVQEETKDICIYLQRFKEKVSLVFVTVAGFIKSVISFVADYFESHVLPKLKQWWDGALVLILKAVDIVVAAVLAGGPIGMLIKYFIESKPITVETETYADVLYNPMTQKLNFKISTISGATVKSFPTGTSQTVSYITGFMSSPPSVKAVQRIVYRILGAWKIKRFCNQTMGFFEKVDLVVDFVKNDLKKLMRLMTVSYEIAIPKDNILYQLAYEPRDLLDNVLFLRLSSDLYYLSEVLNDLYLLKLQRGYFLNHYYQLASNEVKKNKRADLIKALEAIRFDDYEQFTQDCNNVGRLFNIHTKKSNDSQRNKQILLLKNRHQELKSSIISYQVNLGKIRNKDIRSASTDLANIIVQSAFDVASSDREIFERFSDSTYALEVLGKKFHTFVVDNFNDIIREDDSRVTTWAR